MTPALTPAVFLDRDGTLMEEVNYCRDPQLVRAFPGTRETLASLRARGFQNIIITNQSGIGRGWITLPEYEAVHAALLEQIGPENISGTYFCPDVPGQISSRRKPEPGMVLEAAQDHALDLGGSWFVGDKESDVECGRRAGVRTVLVKTGYGSSVIESRADFVVADLPSAADAILRSSASAR